jgi:hypothetical protein
MAPSLFAQTADEYREAEPFQIKGFTYPLKEGIRLGPVHLHGYLVEHVRYDSNLFLANSATSDFLFDTLMGIRSDLHLDKSLVSLFFDGEYIKAYNQSTYDKLNYDVGATGKFKFSDFFLNLDAAWSDHQEPENVRVLGWNTVHHQNLECNLDTGIKLGRLGIEGGGAFWMRRFGTGGTQTLLLGDGSSINLARDYLNHFEAAGNLRLAYIWAKMRIFVSGAVGTVQFFDKVMHDYMYGTVLGGGTLTIAKKVDAEVVMGYSMQIVSGINDYQTLQDDSEFSGFVGLLRLNYFFSEKLKANLHFVQALQFSGSSNYQIYDSLGASVSHRILPRLAWTLDLGIDYIDPSDNYNYTIFRASLLVDYQLLSWAAIGLEGDFRMRKTKISSLNYTSFGGALVLALFL